MAENDTQIFRKKSLESISSPEQLTDYLCVTNPGIWAILAAVILLLGGLFAWATVGTLETRASVKVIVDDHTAQVIPVAANRLAEGMPLRVSSEDSFIASTGVDDYGRLYGVAEVQLPDGTYDGDVVLSQTHPIEFLLTSN